MLLAPLIKITTKCAHGSIFRGTRQLTGRFHQWCNIVVHALLGDRYCVAEGGRRLAALNMLAEGIIIPSDWPVRAKVISQELATAVSMTRNGNRKDIHPAEQIAGFRAMTQEGKTPAQIGDLLVYSPSAISREC